MLIQQAGQPRDPEKVQRILTAALHEFATLGYHAAKTAVIAAEARVSKGLIFHYFGNKAKLYLAVAEDVFARLNQVADWSVWQDAPDLTTMVTRALRYKIQLQLEYRDEMAFGLAMYGGNDLPEAERPALAALFDKEVKLASGDLIGPVLARLHLREGVSPAVVQALIRGMITTVTDQARPFLDAHPNARVEDLDWLVSEVRQYLAVLEHGFLAE